MSEHTGGTVTYHRAEWMDGMWAVTFLEDGPRRWLTPAEGEAMGLTVPEPAPLVVTCNGHSVELSDEQARLFVESWAKYVRTWSAVWMDVVADAARGGA